jgi:hypothetical protein
VSLLWLEAAGLKVPRLSTTTERGGSSALSSEPESIAPEKASGFTFSGLATVLWASSSSAVRIVPDTEPTLAPWIVAFSVTVAFGSMFTRLRCRRPWASFEAEALTAGIVSPP